MKKNMIYMIVMLAALFHCCAEDKGTYTYEPINDLEITGIPYERTVVQLETLKITPQFNRTLLQSEEGLEYSWTMAGKEIGTERDLNYVIPAGTNIGKYDCKYTVMDAKTGMKYFNAFNIRLLSSFSWGYYFLCEGKEKATVLSYFSTREGTTECLHTDRIGDYILGYEPKTIVESFGIISSLDAYQYTFHIVSSQGENPVIVTNNGALTPMALINNSSFMYGEDSFHPTDAFLSGNYFISDGRVYSYTSNLLYRPAKHDKEYKWSNPVANRSVFVLDEISKKFYVIKRQINDPVLGLVADPYALDRVVEIKKQPSYEGQTIIGKSVLSDGTADILWLATADEGKINLISLKYTDFQNATNETPEIKEDGYCNNIETLPLTTANANTKGVLTEHDWYFVSGNKVYTSPVLKPALTELVALPDDLGQPVSVALSSKNTDLIIATYDSGSSQENKGSFVLVNLTTKEVTVHRNVMGKCVVAKGFDANPWF